jgi:GDP-4-dehydro-6-deoxy-D-mannose reductase
MRILITGISGFIGQHLADQLIADGHDIHGIYEHPESRAKNPAIPDSNQHVLTLTDHQAVEDTVQHVQPEIVLHMASRSEVALSFRNYIEVSNVNYVAAINLAEACRRFANDFTAFIFASTMETYGNAYPLTRIRAFTEDTPQFPMAPYAVAKLAVERYLAYMGYGYQFPHIILRQTNTYGRRDNSFFIVERIISQMLAGKECNLGVSWPVRNFLFITDLVEFYRVLIDRLPIGETFVTGPANAVTIGELAGIIAAKLDWDGSLNWGTVPIRAAEVPYLNSDPAKARHHLGWEPQVNLSEGLDRCIEFWRTAATGPTKPTWDQQLVYWRQLEGAA